MAPLQQLQCLIVRLQMVIFQIDLCRKMLLCNAHQCPPGQGGDACGVVPGSSMATGKPDDCNHNTRRIGMGVLPTDML